MGIRQRQALASSIGLVGFVLALVAFLLMLDSPRSAEVQPWVPIGLALAWGLRAAYDHRSDSLPVRLMWAAVYGLGSAAIILALELGLQVLAETIGPWVRSQAMPTETTIALGATGLVLIVMATIVGDERPSAVRRGLALWSAIGLLACGLWLVSQGGLVAMAGIAAALAAPVLHYQADRMLNRSDAIVAARGAPSQADAPP